MYFCVRSFKWYLYSRLPLTQADINDIGAVSGSNEERWLEHNGYRIKLRVSAAEQLLALLLKERIDTAVFDEARMEHAVRTAPAGPHQQLYHEFLRFAPMRSQLTGDLLGVIALAIDVEKNPAIYL